jgi:uncharacterized membrane protein (UPF0127 family)
MRWWRGVTVLAVSACLLAPAACGGEGDNASTKAKVSGRQESELPTAVFESASGATATMTIEVADTDELRICGLMHRLSMPEDQGMLFVFERDSNGAFWNRNTFIPLTLAWIAADGSIVDLTDMDPVRPEDSPQRNTLYSPRAGYRYVIEANRGWFERKGIAIGDKARLEDALARGSQGAVPICREKGTDPVGGG